MRETITLKGLVLRTTRVKDSDKYLDILTDKLGRIAVYSHGTRSYKSRNSAVADMFRYAEFTVSKSGSGYTLKESYEIAGFYQLMTELPKLALAQYICDVICDITQEESPEEDILRTALNALYALSSTDIPPAAVKSVCELRFAAAAGFMPEISSCIGCARPFDGDQGWMLNISEGGAVCPDCAEKLNVEDRYYDNGRPKPFSPLPMQTQAAMRHILTSDPKKSFGFRLDEAGSAALSSLSEEYLLYHLDRKFTTLDFYRSCTL